MGLGVPNSFWLWNSDYFLEKEIETLRTLHCGMAGKSLYSRHSTYRSFPDRNNVHTGPWCPTAPTQPKVFLPHEMCLVSETSKTIKPKMLCETESRVGIKQLATEYGRRPAKRA